VIAHEGVKRGLRSRGVGADVVGELGGREVRSPVVLSNRSVRAEILFKFLINPFRLTIGLQVISRGEGLIYIQKGTEVTSESSGELRTAIRYEFTRETEVSPYVITVEGSRAVSSDGGMTRGKDGGFRDIMVNKDGDGVETIRLGSLVIKSMETVENGVALERGGIG